MSRIPLLLLPGLLCDDWLWHAQVGALSDIASPVVANLTLDDSVEAMAFRALSDAPDSFALAGLSMGGYVAFEIMRQAPQRVLRLALFDTRTTPDDAERTAERRRSTTSLGYGRFTGVTQTMLRQLVHPSHVDTPVGAGVRAMADRVGREAYLRQVKAIEHRPDSVPLLRAISVPTLVGVGDSDQLTPLLHSQRIHEQVSQSVLHVFRQCGHLPALEVPEEMNGVLRDWLSV